MRFIKEVRLKHYKSIGSALVPLSDLTVLVGPNGSGKSNFLDALSFVSEALGSTLDFAIRQRGGIGDVRRRSGGHPTHFTIDLRLCLPSGREAAFAFQIGAEQHGGFKVQREKAFIEVDDLFNAISYEVREGEIQNASKEISPLPRISSDRLLLQSLSGLPIIRELYDFLSGMRLYNIIPTSYRWPQPHDNGEALVRSGANLAAVLRTLSTSHPDRLDRITEYLKRIVPDLVGVDHKLLGPSETIEFKQLIEKQKNPWRFYAAQMSDGTLRALGVLAAINQTSTSDLYGSLIGIEEPESTIHPYAATILMDALIEASSFNQILVTTHSPELLDHPDLSIDDIRIVNNIKGDTKITLTDRAAKNAVKSKLMSPGELLRMNQLSSQSDGRNTTQPDLFGFGR